MNWSYPFPHGRTGHPAPISGARHGPRRGSGSPAFPRGDGDGDGDGTGRATAPRRRHSLRAARRPPTAPSAGCPAPPCPARPPRLTAPEPRALPAAGTTHRGSPQVGASRLSRACALGDHSFKGPAAAVCRLRCRVLVVCGTGCSGRAGRPARPPALPPSGVEVHAAGLPGSAWARRPLRGLA